MGKPDGTFLIKIVLNENIRAVRAEIYNFLATLYYTVRQFMYFDSLRAGFSKSTKEKKDQRKERKLVKRFLVGNKAM